MTTADLKPGLCNNHLLLVAVPPSLMISQVHRTRLYRRSESYLVSMIILTVCTYGQQP